MDLRFYDMGKSHNTLAVILHVYVGCDCSLLFLHPHSISHIVGCQMLSHDRETHHKSIDFKDLFQNNSIYLTEWAH